QRTYKTDIFGFGKQVRQRRPEVWKEVSGEWDSIFPQLEVKIDTKINIRNSALNSKPLVKGE
ncbi:MAG TPA: Ger(x)C family spore germination C-terminal domain-containing protein, partial [Bacillota bacterium]|nr:Ger(x)C family spore germination C-terminal domain-containing protein [Bacillota bacterium]